MNDPAVKTIIEGEGIVTPPPEPERIEDDDGA
jgi:hypothetical protein